MKLPLFLVPSRATAAKELSLLILKLSEPLAQTDRDGGWTESSQAVAREIATEAFDQVINGRPCPATFHFARWLDHHGVGDGELFERICQVQYILPKPLSYNIERWLSGVKYRLTHRSTRTRRKRTPVS